MILDADQSANQTQLNGDRTDDESRSNGDRTADQMGTVDVLQDQIDYLREQLDQERQARTEERRRHDTLMAQLMQRIPEIEAPQEPRQSPETNSEGTVGGEPSESVSTHSWWRRLFGVY